MSKNTEKKEADIDVAVAVVIIAGFVLQTSIMYLYLMDD